MNYQPQTLGRVIGFLAKGKITGLTVEDDKLELIDVVNSYRNYLYNIYDKVRLFDEYVSCLPIECYKLACAGVCDDKYYGFTLPHDMAGISQAWFNSSPLSVRSRWHEGKEHLVSLGYADEDLQAGGSITPISGDFAIPRPMPVNAKLRIIAENRGDKSKAFTILARYIVEDEHGNKTNEDYTFTGQLGGVVETEVAVFDITSISMPYDLCGAVRIEDEHGNLIVIVSPSDPNPRFRRYKISEKCSCYPSILSGNGKGHVAIKGRREYKELHRDSDIVEIGDRRIIEHFGLMNRYEFSTEASEVNIAKNSKEDLMTELKGLVARYRSGEKQDSVKPFNRHDYYSHERLTR